MTEKDLSFDARILHAFLEAKEQYVSGNSLAKELGMSRVAIWNRLEQLKTTGFVFDAIRNRGYRLLKTPDHLHPDLLSAHLAGDGVKLPIHYFETIDSTNSEAERRLSHGEAEPFLVLAGEQTAGRGRRGRVWHSPKAVHFYGSFAFRPAISPMRLQTITLWWGLSLCRYLHQVWKLDVKVKWPNDLYLNGRKVAGLLTEARVNGEQTRDLILGLGMNLAGVTEDFPAELQDRAGTLSMGSETPLPLHPLAGGIIQTILSSYKTFINQQYTDDFLETWERYDYLRGRHVETDQGEGEVLGINSQGSLRLRREDGSQLTLHAGEVSVRV